MPRSGKYIPIVLLLTLLLGSARQARAPESAAGVVPSGKTEIVIAAVGDIMMPMSIQRAVARNKDNYDLLFEKIAPDLTSADIVFANLETPVDHKAAVSGYPKFNARPGLLTALRKAGVGIVSVANNHALDRGADGLKRTLDNIEAAGLRFTGAGRTKAEAGKAANAAVRGVSVAFLAYTYDTNEGLPRKRKDAPGVNILKTGSEADLARALEAVGKERASADLVVVSLHWSDEYRTVPTPWQRKVAGALIGAGADVVLGHHPHVLQPVESYAAQDGRQGLIAFSLGNFIATQNYGVSNRNRTHARALRGDGIILTIFAVKENGKTSVKRVEFLPIWTLRDRVGKTALFRPVSLAREIARIEGIHKRTKGEEDTLKLLKFRKKVITDTLTVKTAR